MTFTLTAAEFAAAWTTSQLGDLPLILRVGIDQSDLTTDLTGTDGLAPQLHTALNVLANAQWAINAWLVTHHADPAVAAPDTIRAHGAAGHDDLAVIAKLTSGRLTITRSTPYRLPADMAELAGQEPAGGGYSINLPTETLFGAIQAGHGDRDQTIDELVDRGVQRGEAGTATTIAWRAGRHGQFEIEVVTADGIRCPAPGLVGFCDTPSGRWAQLRTTAHDSDQDWITITPADQEQLATMITDRLTASGLRLG